MLQILSPGGVRKPDGLADSVSDAFPVLSQLLALLEAVSLRLTEYTLYMYIHVYIYIGVYICLHICRYNIRYTY